VLGTHPPCELTANLQRPIALYLERHGPVTRRARAAIGRPLVLFNEFLNRTRPGGEGQATIDEAMVIAWLRHLSRKMVPTSVCAAASQVTLFLDFLVAEKRLADNPFKTIWQRYRGQPRLRIIGTISGLPQDQPAVPMPPRPRFVSHFAAHVEDFINLKRALGRRYGSPVTILAAFDRFLGQQAAQRITRGVVNDWLAGSAGTHPVTVSNRLSAVRQFCIYMSRVDPDTYIPERSPVCAQTSHYKPYIFSTAEVRALLDAAENLPGRPHHRAVAPTLLLLLYSTGLRISEALHLQMKDVDLEACVLHVRDTKFFKSRLVPISVGLKQRLDRFLEIRRSMGPTDGNAFLFINCRRRRYTYKRARDLFCMSIRRAGLPHRDARMQPRLHHLRHTFAVHRLLRWYREGADIHAKLPLLSTYLGHGNVLSTHTYLTATSEVLAEATNRFERRFCSMISPRNEVPHDGES